MVPVLEEVLKDFDAAPAVRGGLEDCSFLQVLLRNVMRTGKNGEETPGPQDAQALEDKVPHSLECAGRASPGFREGRGVEDRPGLAVPVPRCLRQ